MPDGGDSIYILRPKFSNFVFWKEIQPQYDKHKPSSNLESVSHLLNNNYWESRQCSATFFLVKSKTSQYTLLYIATIPPNPVPSNFPPLLHTISKYVNPKFSPAPNFENRFSTNSRTNSDSAPHILGIYPYICISIDKFIIRRQ